jgi:hypothetical protein
MQDVIYGNDGRQPGESLLDQEADQDAMEGISHLLSNYNEGQMTDDELLELIGQSLVTRRHIYPGHGTDGLLGNMHTSKVAIIVGRTENEFGEGERLGIRLKQDTKCIHGLQGYNPSTRNDLRKQSRPSLDLKVKKLASLVSFYFTPYKTRAETERIPAVLQNIRTTLSLLKEAIMEQIYMAQFCHRRPVRLELFYNESAESFFHDELLFPNTHVSIAEGIVQVNQGEVVRYHFRSSNFVIQPLISTFDSIGAAPDPDSLDAEEKTYLAYAAEAMAVLFGCFPAEGPIFKTLRMNLWKSPLSFQPHHRLRLQVSQETYRWTKIPYRLKTCVRPCAFETGQRLDQIHVTELREKERRKLELDIAVQMRKIVRIPFLFAKAKACVLGLLHKWGNSNPESSVVDTFGHLNTPGLFDDIQFEALAHLDDDNRHLFLDRAIDSILELYSAEWRDILDRKLVRLLQQSSTTSNGRSLSRLGTPRRADCVLPPDIAMPVTWSEVCSMRSTHHVPSDSVVLSSLGPRITDAACKFLVSVFLFLFVGLAPPPPPTQINFLTNFCLSTFSGPHCFTALVAMMFRDWDNSPPLVNKTQWKMSPSRCAWGYLDHMLSYVRLVITDADRPPEATPGRRIPYSREEVSDTLARRVMAQVESSDDVHAHLQRAIVWRSAMGHQYEGQLQATEVRINLDRPTGGTHDAVVPSVMRGSPECVLLQDRRDSFHTLLLLFSGTFIMNIFILRLVTLVATRDYLLNGLAVPLMALYRKIANSQIAEGYCLHFMYDSEKTCLEAIKNCYKKHTCKDFFAAEDMTRFVKELPPGQAKILWELVTPHCNMDVMQEAANLVYHRPDSSGRVDYERLEALTDAHGRFSLFGSGDNATNLDSAVVDVDGNPFQGNNYMHAACSLVVKTGIVTRFFTQALVSERGKFCTNRINHINAALTPTDAPLELEITEANKILASDTFGSTRYQPKHDLEFKAARTR